jgi:hypothetical protein
LYAKCHCPKLYMSYLVLEESYVDVVNRYSI